MGVQDFWLRIRVGGVKLRRLESKVAVTRESLQQRATAGASGGWLEAARKSLDRADAAIADRSYDGAWEHLHEARQQEVYGYSDAELRTMARTLHAEATAKLGSWRQISAIHHLTPILDCEGPGEEERVKLIDAMRTRDEHYDNQYFKLRLVQKQVLLLLGLLLLLLLTFAIFFWTRHGSLTSPNTGIGPSKLLAGILVGAIGACFSGLLSLVSTSPTGTIPERIASTTITFARPAIGAVSGFAAILLLSAGLLGNLPATTILAVAFAFGFSERLAIGALEKVGSR